MKKKKKVPKKINVTLCMISNLPQGEKVVVMMTLGSTTCSSKTVSVSSSTTKTTFNQLFTYPFIDLYTTTGHIHGTIYTKPAPERLKPLGKFDLRLRDVVLEKEVNTKKLLNVYSIQSNIPLENVQVFMLLKPINFGYVHERPRTWLEKLLGFRSKSSAEEVLDYRQTWTKQSEWYGTQAELKMGEDDDFEKKKEEEKERLKQKVREMREEMCKYMVFMVKKLEMVEKYVSVNRETLDRIYTCLHFDTFLLNERNFTDDMIDLVREDISKFLAIRGPLPPRSMWNGEEAKKVLRKLRGSPFVDRLMSKGMVYVRDPFPDEDVLVSSGMLRATPRGSGKEKKKKKKRKGDEGNIIMLDDFVISTGGEEDGSSSQDQGDVMLGVEEESESAVPFHLGITQRVYGRDLRAFEEADSSQAKDGSLGKENINLAGVSYVEGKKIVRDRKVVGEYTGYMAPVSEGESMFLPHGENGKLVSPDGKFCFMGQFVVGKKCGAGVLYEISRQNTHFLRCNTWRDDLPVGKCFMQTPDGVQYLGSVITTKKKFLAGLTLPDFLKHGTGSLRQKRSVYFGQFRKNKREGFGILDSDDGERYIGMWIKDHRSCKYGAISRLDGTVFSGGWEQSRLSGMGALKSSNLIEVEASFSPKGFVEKVKKFNIEANIEGVSDDVVEMMRSELGRRTAFGARRGDKKTDSKRNEYLWRSFVDGTSLQMQLETLPLWQITTDIIEEQVNNRNGYLHSSLMMFTEYFKSFYSIAVDEGEDELKLTPFQSQRKRLVYARDDITSFVDHLESVYIGKMKELCHEQYMEDRRDENGKILKLHRSNFRKVLLEFIHRRVFDNVMHLYREESKQEEFVLRQKVRSIKHAIENLLAGKKKIQSVEFKLKKLLQVVETKTEIQQNEIAALNCLFKSIVTKNEKMRMGSEKAFLVRFNQAIGKKILSSARRYPELKREISEYVPNEKTFKNINLESGKKLVKRLVHVLRICRIGLQTIFQMHRSRQLLIALEHTKDAIDIDRTSPMCEAYRNLLTSIINGCGSLVELIARCKEEEVVICKKEPSLTVSSFSISIMRSIESIYNLIESISVPGFMQQNSCFFKASQSGVESIACILVRVGVDRDHPIFNRLERAYLGNPELMRENAQAIDLMIAEISLSENMKGKDEIFYLQRRWRTSYELFTETRKIEKKKCINNIKNQCVSLREEFAHFKALKVLSPKLLDSFFFVLLSIESDFSFLISINASHKLYQFVVDSIKKRLTGLKNVWTKSLELYKEDSIMDYLFSLGKHLHQSFVESVSYLNYFEVKNLLSKQKEHSEKLLMESQKINVVDNVGTKRFQAVVSQLNQGMKRLNNEKMTFDTEMVLESLRTGENGVESILFSMEVRDLRTQFEKLSKSVVEMKKVKEMLQVSIEKIHDSCIEKKLSTILDYVMYFEEDKSLSNPNLTLEILGVPAEFIPPAITVVVPVKEQFLHVPYSQSIQVLNSLTEKKSIEEKVRAMKSLSETVGEEMRRYSAENSVLEEEGELEIEHELLNSWKKKDLQEDHILPVIQYVLFSSDINCVSEYKYLLDWGGRNAQQMLVRFQIYQQQMKQLDPYTLANTGELTMSGTILSPIKMEIESLKKDNVVVPILPLINLFNHIYCEVGFLKSKDQGDGEIMMINNQSLNKALLRNVQIFQKVLKNEKVGFNIQTHSEIISCVVVVFKKFYPPSIYKWIGEEIGKSFL